MVDTCSVSVILPFYNAGDTIYRALRSVFNQKLLPFEIIIVNDCSRVQDSKQLADAIKKCTALTKNVEVKVVTVSQNKGASFARNLAIKNSSGKYLSFLDSDDVWCEDKIATQFFIMERNNLFMTAHNYVFDLTHSSFSKGDYHCTKVYKWQFIFKNPFFTPTVMVRRLGFVGFDSSFRRCDDYKCWLENYNSQTLYIGLDLAGGFKRPIGSSGLTGSLPLMHLSYLEVLKSLLNEGRISVVFYLLAGIIECIKYPFRIIRCRYLQ